MGCGESKHAVATTESFSTHKILNYNSSKKVQSVEEPHETKATDIDENSNKIHSDTSNVVQKKETTTNATRHESFVKQGKDTNMCINDIMMDLPFELIKDPKNKDILGKEDVTPNKEKEHNQEISLESQEESDNEIKFDKNLSAQHEPAKKLSLYEGLMQDIIVEGDNDLDDKINSDENLFPQSENNEIVDLNEGEQLEINNKRGEEINYVKYDENNVSPQSESVNNVASGKEEKQDVPIKGDDYINKKSNIDENLYPQLESTKNFSSDEEGNKKKLVQEDNNSKNEEQEKNKDGILGNLNEDINNEKALIDKETTPNGGQDDVMDSTVS